LKPLVLLASRVARKKIKIFFKKLLTAILPDVILTIEIMKGGTPYELTRCIKIFYE
jgi:hypothetical protein